MNSMENTLPLNPEESPETAETLADTGFGDILRDFETQRRLKARRLAEA